MARDHALERADVETLALSVALVPALWFVALGLGADQSVGGHDQIAQTLPLVHDLLEHAHGDWTRFSYRAELLGGAKVHDVAGTLPLYQWLGGLGVGTLFALNAVLFFTQVACAFFGVRLAYDLARVATDKPKKARWVPRLGIVVLTAFSPTLAWRMTTGHDEEVWGALLGVSVVALLLAYRNKTLTFTLVAMTVVTHLQAFQTKGQQLVYGAVFFGVVVVAAALPLRPVRKLLVPALVIAGCLALSLPKLAGMLDHESGSDAGRGLGGSSVVYSYITATLHDWVSSIPWGMEVIPFERDVSYWHEINFGFGPLVVLLALLPWKKERLLAIGLGVSFLLPMLFSMDVPGVAWVLTHVFPPLRAFRVPERAMLSFALVVPMFASAALLIRPCPKPARGLRVIAAVVGAGVLMFFAPEGLREVLAWGIPLAVVLRPVFQWPVVESIPTVALLIPLAAGSLAAFKERIRPYSSEANLFDAPAKLGKEIRAERPELDSPLVRIVMHVDLDDFQTNTAYAMGLSSLSGYLNPPRRFLALEAALSGTQENLLRNYYRLDETALSFRVLSPLYNVKLGAFPEPHKLRLSPIGETAGPAWFSGSFTRVGTMSELAAALHATEGTLATEAHAQAWLVTSDEAVVAADLPETVAPGCTNAAVHVDEAVMGGQRIRLHVDAPAACPLTLAMNYATDLHATADGRPLSVFPAYGALAGVWVPRGTHDVVVEARAVLPLWARVGWFVGLALVLLALGETWRLVVSQRATRAPRRRRAVSVETQ